MKRFWDFCKSTGGNTAIIFALAAVPLFLGSGAAVDMVRANQTRTLLQGAADAAAIAGATSGKTSDAELKVLVADYLKANGAIDALSYVESVTQEFNSTKSKFTVKISGQLNTGLMHLAGISTMDISVLAQVSVGGSDLEVALVLDNTGSMGGAKIQNLKTAAKKFVAILHDGKSAGTDLKIGVVPFAEYVNVGASYAAEPWISLPNKIPAGSSWKGCVGSRTSPKDEQVDMIGGKYPALLDTGCSASLLPLTSDKQTVDAKINAMVATGNTYIPIGLLWGWNLLDNGMPFTEAMSKAEMKKSGGRKAIVLMTDGENTISATYPRHDGKNPAKTDTLLARLCKTVKTEDIEIFTVSFAVNSKAIKQLLTNCASKPENAFDAADGAALSAAFSSIGRTLSGVRLTQ